MHFDPAGTSLMPYDKFTVALEKMGFLSLQERQKRELFDAMDINMDGFITFDEFDSVVSGCRKFVAEAKKSKEEEKKKKKEEERSAGQVPENTSGTGLIVEEEEEETEDGDKRREDQGHANENSNRKFGDDDIVVPTGDEEIDELVNDISLLE